MTNFELMSKPPDAREPDNPWPQWPRVYGVDYGHAEVNAVFGSDPREFSVLTKEFKGDVEGNLTSLVTQECEMTAKGPQVSSEASPIV